MQQHLLMHQNPLPSNLPFDSSKCLVPGHPRRADSQNDLLPKQTLVANLNPTSADPPLEQNCNFFSFAQVQEANPFPCLKTMSLLQIKKFAHLHYTVHLQILEKMQGAALYLEMKKSKCCRSRWTPCMVLANQFVTISIKSVTLTRPCKPAADNVITGGSADWVEDNLICNTPTTNQVVEIFNLTRLK